MNWAAIVGDFDFYEDALVFKGKPAPYTNPKGEPQTGLAGGLVIGSPCFVPLAFKQAAVFLQS